MFHSFIYLSISQTFCHGESTHNLRPISTFCIYLFHQQQIKRESAESPTMLFLFVINLINCNYSSQHFFFSRTLNLSSSVMARNGVSTICTQFLVQQVQCGNSDVEISGSATLVLSYIFTSFGNEAHKEKSEPRDPQDLPNRISNYFDVTKWRW